MNAQDIEEMCRRIRNVKPPFTEEQRQICRSHERKLKHLIQYPRSQEEAMSQLNATKVNSSTPLEE